MTIVGAYIEEILQQGHRLEALGRRNKHMLVAAIMRIFKEALLSVVVCGA
jgi:hypothetical protein